MKCPHCQSEQINKNGHRRGKQCYLCKSCGRQFIEFYTTKGYSEDAKQICLKMYRDGIGLRAIERSTGISHNTVSNWVRKAGSTLHERPNNEELDETIDSRSPSFLEQYKVFRNHLSSSNRWDS
ncbi:transposase-like zinc-binding domain-containing protein [Myxacorys almedinensis]|uniref:IS1/IS1595 family N-terminal zinc-binding domain-containing protein n=1 Tax=Myxacorys almedinensis TaxID=2651157 RepID=UPI003B75D0C4